MKRHYSLFSFRLQHFQGKFVLEMAQNVFSLISAGFLPRGLHINIASTLTVGQLHSLVLDWAKIRVGWGAWGWLSSAVGWFVHPLALPTCELMTGNKSWMRVWGRVPSGVTYIHNSAAEMYCKVQRFTLESSCPCMYWGHFEMTFLNVNKLLNQEHLSTLNSVLVPRCLE